MKRFKFLGALFIWLIWLISFWYTARVYVWWVCDNTADSQLWWKVCNYYTWSSFDNSYWIYLNCISTEWNAWILFVNSNNSVLGTYNTTCHPDWVQSINFSVPSWTVWFYVVWQSNSPIVASIRDNNASQSSFYFRWMWWSCPDCPDCPSQYTSEECQSEYSLMPIWSCDSEYCELNWMCGVSWTWLSELYINWINHLSAPEINLLIPLEYQWDYLYTWDILNINISWYNVDYEYIDNIIRTQNSTPNDTDLNNIVSGLTPLFVPWLVLILFILFVFRFIKKIF